MKPALESKDAAIVASILSLGVINGVSWHILGLDMAAESWFRWIEGGVILLTLAFLFRARGLWGGEIARSIDVITMGIAVYLIQYIPHIGYHIQEHPVWLGLGEGFWIGLFHGVSAASFLVVTYGIYLLSQASIDSRREKID